MHGTDTDTAGKEGGLEGLTRTKEHPDQVEKDRSSFVCEQCQFSDLNVTVWKHTFEQNKGHVLFPLFHVY